MIILAINAGSSSVKVCAYAAQGKKEEPTQLAVAQVGGLTAPPARLDYRRGDVKIKGKVLGSHVESQEAALRCILDQLTQDAGLPELSHRDDIAFACHRIVHGCDYATAQIIDRETYHRIEELSDLAPLHNAAALTIVRALVKELPRTRNIAFFDSSFHSTIPAHIYTYPINQQIAKAKKLRKYGFHGISYAFIVSAVARHMQKDATQVNIIALHLGSGASVCAIRNGASMDTTMGLTPLCGLPGATRSGDIDPSLVFHFTNDADSLAPNSTKEMHITTAEDILNKRSGWSALTGTTDFARISSSNSPECRLAYNIFVDRIVNYVGAYYLKLGGDVDAIVFAGGIGEKSARLRQSVVKSAGCLGFELDDQKNEHASDSVVVDVGREGAKHRVLVCQTDEQLEMARSCVRDAEQLAVIPPSQT